MSNKFRGTALLVVTNDEGQKITHKLQYDANALVEFEAASGITLGGIVDVFNTPSKMSMTFVRAMLWAGLVSANPDLTLSEAGEILSDAGMEPSVKAIQEAFTSATRARKAKASKPGE